MKTFKPFLPSLFYFIFVCGARILCEREKESQLRDVCRSDDKCSIWAINGAVEKENSFV